MNLFKGRTSRTVFFLSTISLNLLMFFSVAIIKELVRITGEIDVLVAGLVFILGVLFMLFLLLVSFSLVAKRWQDIGKTGNLALLNLIPILSQVISICLFFVPGDSKKNKYGEKPVSIRF